jgi:hypothetical protein
MRVSRKRLAQQGNTLKKKRSSDLGQFQGQKLEEEYDVHDDGVIDFHDAMNDEDEDESDIDDQQERWYDVVSEDEDSADERDGGIEGNDYEVDEEELNKLIRMEKDWRRYGNSIRSCPCCSRYVLASREDFQQSKA